MADLNFVIELMCALVLAYILFLGLLELFISNEWWKKLLFSPWVKSANKDKKKILFQAMWIALVVFTFIAILFLAIASFREEHSISKMINKILSDETILLGICSGYTGCVSILFWELRKTFEAKWTYAADLFNQIVSFNVNDELDLKVKNNLKACLAIDIYLMDFDEHISFKGFYQKVLNEAQEYLRNNGVNIFKFKRDIDLLDVYQEKLSEDIDYSIKSKLCKKESPVQMNPSDAGAAHG